MGSSETTDELVSRKRRRLLPLLVAGAVLLVGTRLSGAMPREVSLRYELGPSHAMLTETRIGYRRDGEEIQSVRFAYAGGAPASVAHRPSLSPGHYDIVADVLGVGGSQTFVRTLDVPVEGVVRFRLFDEIDR